VAHNVLGGDLRPCSTDPLTGFYRNGCCDTGGEDTGVHTVCVRVTAEFLEFSSQVGNDLSTPAPEYGFGGLRPGDQCACVRLAGRRRWPPGGPRRWCWRPPTPAPWSGST